MKQTSENIMITSTSFPKSKKRREGGSLINGIKNFIITIAAILFSLNVSAQGPSAPEAGSFEPVDATDMVNLLTGDLTYVLPVLTVPGPEGGYPLALSYHAGIAMDQEASWVGLGWNLNPGSIIRGVNGYPDDWSSGKLVERFYDVGGSETETTISTSFSLYNIYTIGSSVSFNSNKGFGGAISFGLGVATGEGGSLGLGATLGVRPGGGFYASADVGYNSISGFSIGGTIGTDGVGIDVGYRINEGGNKATVGVGYYRSFQGGDSFSITFSKPEYGKAGSIGINFSSDNISVSIAGISHNVSHVQSVSTNDYNTDHQATNKGISIPSPIGTFSFGFNKQKTRWALNTKKTSYVSSTLYMNQAKKYLCTISIDHFEYDELTQMTTLVDDPADCDCQIINNSSNTNNFTCLDVISVSTEMISNSKYFMDINEIGDSGQIQNLSFNNAVFPSYDHFNVSAQGLSGKMTPNIFQSGALLGLGHHKFEDWQGQYELFYRLPGPTDWQSDYTDFTRKPNFHFNNEYVSSLIIDPTNFTNNTSAASIFDYLSTNNSNAVAARKRGGNFAQHFTVDDLLQNNTPGLIRPENLNTPNDTFDGIGAYMITTADGKTYHYSLPVYNHETVERTLDVVDKPERESYFESQQLKPYATHWLLTAITGPDYIDVNNNQRVDDADYGYWIDFQYGRWSDAFVWKTPYGKDYEEDGLANTRSITHGRKQLYYLDRIKTRTHTAIFVKNTRNVDNLSEPWAYHAVNYASFPNPATFDTPRFTIPSQKTLRLDRIILVKNEDDNVDKVLGNGLATTQFVDIDFLAEKQERAYFNLEDNIIDIHDNVDDIANNALKIIELGDHYNYELVNGSPNSYSGRLTLHGVSIKGKGGTQLMPSYNFTYDNSKNFNLDKQSDWGYHTDKPEAWSLTEILTPVGGTLSITYESDSFHSLAAPNGKPINDGLKFTLQQFPQCFQTGTIRFKIEKDTADDNSPIMDMSLTELFSTNDPIFFDFYEVAYRNVPGSSDIDWGLIDVPSGMVNIISVTNDHLIVEATGTLHCHDGSNDDRNKILEQNPLTNLSSASGWSFKSVPRGHHSNNPPPYVPDGENYYNLQYTLISNIIPQDEDGGGIRVKGITTSDDLGNAITTKYEYTNPSTGLSSGIISYYPYKENAGIQIPYGSQLPAPAPMYEYVTSKNIVGSNLNSNDYITKTVYQFKVLAEKDPNAIKFGDFFELQSTTLFNHTNIGEDVNVNAKEVTIIDNLACIGQISSIANYNGEGQLLTKTVHEYATPAEMTQGVIQESFQTYKVLRRHFSLRDDWLLNSSSKISYPSVLKSTTILNGGYTTKTNLVSFDTNTGQVLETETFDSNGTAIKTSTVPAYTIYPEMGSKVDDSNYRNMLVQPAVNYTLMDQNGTWKPLSVGITTWNNEWSYKNTNGSESAPTDPAQKIWRKHQIYLWDGETDADGAFQDYTLATHDNFNWSGGEQSEPWQKVSEILRYDHFSLPIEIIDINGNLATTKMGDRDTKVIAHGNAGYSELYYSGAEYTEGGIYLDNEIQGAAFQSSDKAHTGSFSVKLNPGDDFGVILRGGEHRHGKYVMSVWAHKDNHANVRFKKGFGGIPEPFNGERVIAGEWVLMNHYFERTEAQIPNSSAHLIVSNSGTVYVDDFRIHPVDAKMISYVYNEHNELTHILGTNNLGVYYEYDTEGRLLAIYNEIPDTPTLEGGFKLAYEYEYNYKRDGDIGSTGGGGGDDYPPLAGSVSVVLTERECSNPPDPSCDKCRDFTMNVTVDPNTGSGQYSYQWQFRSNLYPDWTDLPNGTGTQAVLSYHIENHNFCILNYEWLEFQCIVSDPGVSMDLPLSTSQQDIDCTCEQE